MTNSQENKIEEILTAEKGTVKIRMYRSGFGDCFLLAFPATNNKQNTIETKYLLIDCGAHHNYPEKRAILNKIAKQIKTATDNRIDVIAVTHEHTDHIHGFNVANDVFKKIPFDRVWMGWTEDYESEAVKELDKKKSLYLKALYKASNKMAEFGATDEEQKERSKRINGVLGFYDEEFFGTRSSSGRKRMYNRETMNWLKDKAKIETKYCLPGAKPLTIDGVDDLRIFVLGPPTNKKLLKKSSPSRGQKKETYLTDGPTEMFDSFVNSVLSIHTEMNEREGDDYELKSPFNELYGKKGEDNKPSMVTSKIYYDQDNSWRTIQNDWMDLTEELAIKMDSHTNNSSLVLAIELGKNGKVLLFPGDAQVGNWLSWRDLEWRIDDEIITVDDLLARTVLYKVGHHGSHNATLKAEGLEKMTNPELTAMIPVDGKYAEEKHNWDIPFEDLLNRIKAKCSNRVIRSDQINHTELNKPDRMPNAEWKEFLGQIEEPETMKQGDYLDYTIKW